MISKMYDFKCQKFSILIRPPQDVDVPAVLDFQTPCFRPDPSAMYARSLLTNLECHGTRASKIQDGEDVDVLRSPDFDQHFTLLNL